MKLHSKLSKEEYPRLYKEEYLGGIRKMEITEREYFALKEQVRQLQDKVDGIKKPQNDLRSLVRETPISNVGNTEQCTPIFDYQHHSTEDTWAEFIKIAKLLHTPSARFYMSETHEHSGIPYIRSICNGTAPRKISDMTEEQIEMSVKMLNEIIPIYNKYFKETHQTVMYSENNDGIYKRVNVCRIDEE